jgi:hypothetical protein
LFLAELTLDVCSIVAGTPRSRLAGGGTNRWFAGEDSFSGSDCGNLLDEKGVVTIMFQPIGLIWGIVTLVFGILVIAYPKFLRYSVGIYLVIVGLWAIIPRL